MPEWFAQLFPKDDFALLAIVLAFPLLGAFVNGVWGARLGKRAVRVMALASVGISFVAAVVTLLQLAREGDLSRHVENGKTVEEHVRLAWTAWEWMHTTGGHSASNVPIALRFSVDALSIVMTLIITGIGWLIHLYATEYMWNDRTGTAGFARFFAYMNLFIFSMLVLVLGDNLPVLFIGWEGVGLCSYLLIGFWYDKMPNAAAGKKAFIANRVGDFGLICAMFLLVHYTGALDWNGIETGCNSLVDPPTDAMRVHVWPIGGGQYQGIFAFLQPHHPFTVSAATAVGLALLLGCTGKSAQIPLYVWLPDAMAGPTPVSALIHAATMVTAGVYLVCRMHFVFVLSPFVMTVIACIGVATALLAALIALVQNDIKKVLAYSTISQLGFMFLGVGTYAFVAGFFHVFTHAFFKACLFLCAGSVIHAMHARVHDDDKAQDIRHMGGLRKYMPVTYWSFLASTAAIIGFPLTSGFFSKDAILFHAYVNQPQHPLMDRLTKLKNPPWMPPPWMGHLLYWLGVAAATMTAFYMCRLLFLTFFGEFRGWAIGKRRKAAAHDDHDTPGPPPRESPLRMTAPLIILATGAVVAGFLLNAEIFHAAPLMAMEHWLAPVFETTTKAALTPLGEEGHKLEIPLALGGVAAFALGSGFAYWMFVVQRGKPEPRFQEQVGRVVQFAPAIFMFVVGAAVLALWTSTARWILGAPLLVGAGLYVYFKNRNLDEFYEATVISAVDALADTSAAFDQWFVDGILAKLTALVVSAFGTVLRAVQTGVVHVYAAVMVLGIAGVGWFFLLPHPDATVTEANGDYTITAGPGIGYGYRWDADGDGKPDNADFTSEGSDAKTIHLDPGKTQTVRLEVKNAFGLTASKSFTLSRPALPTFLEVGQN